MYKLTSGEEIIRLADWAIIPADPENPDRQEYDRWFSEGGIPQPAFTEAELAEKQLARDIETEKAWRTNELAVTARQLEAIEEAEADVPPADLLGGTRKQWLKHRGLVSNWKEGVDPFPDSAQRPVRPE